MIFEIDVVLTDDTMKSIIDDCILGIDIPTTRFSNHITRRNTETLYSAINNIRTECDSIMRGDDILIPEGYDSTTGEYIGSVSNPAPATINDLIDILRADECTSIFNDVCLDYLVSKIVAYSKPDGTGTWDDYILNY